MSKSDVSPSSMGERGPKRIGLSALSEPRSDQPIVELRFVNPDGETEVWMLPKENVDFGLIKGLAQVRLAYLDRGVDSRLAIQNAAIDRLLEHVNSHHQGLAGVFPCSFEKRPDPYDTVLRSEDALMPRRPEEQS